jgi:hypothetical protein
VIVKVQKANALNDSYDVFIERQNGQQNGQVVSLSPIREGFSSTSEDDTKLLQEIKQQSEKALQEQLQQIQQLQSQKVIAEENATQKIPCNKSLLNNKINAYGKMMLNSKGINDYNYPLCSDNSCDNILSDSGSEDYVVNEYRKYQQYVQAYLEDPIIRGSNVNDYDNLSNIDNIGKIDLSNGELQPRPAGYVFQTSPAYNR